MHVVRFMLEAITGLPQYYKTNKALGNWVFSIYAGWTTAIIITFFVLLIELPLIRLFGNRNVAFLNDLEVMDDPLLPVLVGVLLLIVALAFTCSVQ